MAERVFQWCFLVLATCVLAGGYVALFRLGDC